MSMNDTFREMVNFHRELEHFNGHMHVSMSDLQANHDRVYPLWKDDDMWREYNSQWQEFDDMMKNYLRREGPAYERFLAEKLQSLSRYLGHR